MPMLDMSDAILEPNFIDNTITVQRRAETVGSNGRNSFATTTFSNVIAVVTTPGPNELARLPEDERADKTITVVTKFDLRGVSQGYQPDIVVWHGDNFVVKQIDDYTAYGSGFIQARCTIVDSVPAPV